MAQVIDDVCIPAAVAGVSIGDGMDQLAEERVRMPRQIASDVSGYTWQDTNRVFVMEAADSIAFTVPGLSNHGCTIAVVGVELENSIDVIESALRAASDKFDDQPIGGMDTLDLPTLAELDGSPPFATTFGANQAFAMILSASRNTVVGPATV